MVACKPLLLAGDRFVNLNIDMKFIAIEVVQGRFENDEDTLSTRERFWIDKLQTVNNGLNTYHTN